MSGQGADELRIKGLLIKNGVGPDGELPPMPPGPPPGVEEEPEPRAWWSLKRPMAKTTDDQEPAEYEDEEEPDDDEPEEHRPRAFQPQPEYWPHPHMPAVVYRTRDRAEAAISPHTRSFLYNASAAGAGWALGLYSKFAWAIHDLGKTSISGAIVLGVGGSMLIAHVWDRRTRHWWPGIAWCARIPLATAVLALALWAPASAV